MKQYDLNNIINLAVFGHGSSGKTTLCDTFLFIANQTDRIGKTADGSCVMDFDAEEKKRKISISTSVYAFEYNDKKINLIDSPGLFDFAGGMSEALTAADCGLIVLSGKSGLTVGAKQAYESALALKIPTAFFVGKLDSPRSYFYRIISTLTGNYGAKICPVIVPYVEGETVVSFVNLINNKAYSFDGINMTETALPESEDIQNMRSVLLEAVATSDELLMEKYFDGIELTEEEITSALAKGMQLCEICPVFCGINQSGEGVKLALDILSAIAPAANQREYKIKKGETEGKISCNDTSPASAVVFKTIADPFVGKLSYFKVLSGTIKQDLKLINSRTGKEERIGKLMWIKGGKQEDTTQISAGDIGSVAKLGNVLTGDTLYSEGNDFSVVSSAFPRPCLTMAVNASKKGDEEKIAQGLMKLSDEDPTVKFFTNTETKEQILCGLGEQHLDVVTSKLKSKFGVDVTLSAPKVAYRETIRKKVKVQGRYKKQSGGHGQFGDVWIEFEPCDEMEMVFVDKVFGGAVPKNFFPAVEKGLRDCTQKGVLAGYPLVGLKATLVDGSYHPVDSSEMSFKMAAAAAYKSGIPTASPVLLEPIGTLSVFVPDDNMGDTIGDINKRRGRVLGMNPQSNHMQEIIAEVPMAEMNDFSTSMRSITQCRATFDFEFSRYDEAPSFISEKIIALNKTNE